MPSARSVSSNDRGNVRLRRADRVLGVPLIALLGMLRPRRVAPARFQSIGFLLLGAIGDSLLAATVIAALRHVYPATRFVCFVNSSNRSLGDFLEGVDELVDLPIRSPFAALNILRTHRTDVLIDFGPWPRVSAILAALSGSGFTIGFQTAGQARHFAYDAVVPHLPTRHEIDNFHALAAPLIGEPTNGRPRLAVPAGKPVLPTEPDWIVFHPWPSGYRHEWRAWPHERWVALGREVQSWGYGVVITGGPSDRAAAERLAEGIGGAVLVLAGRESLRNSIKALAEARAIVAVNTGVMHLAAALDRPMVALHGPTNPLRWGPLSDNAIIVGPGPERNCAYLDLGFEYPDKPPDCMGCISVAEVSTALATLLGR